MTLNVLLFASWSDALGPAIALELPEGSRVSDLLATLATRTDGRSLPKPLVAVNQRYARSDLVIQPGDEVAIIPPVSGG